MVPPDCIHLLDFGNASFDRAQNVTQDHLQDVLDRVTGSTDVKITKIHVSSSYTDRCKQASTYRKGRIILAGDAAHIHSPLGAQGMNLGLGDAMNLGWKLAATIRQESKLKGEPIDLALLNTYESERRPVAAWALDWTRAQVATLQPELYGTAIRTLVHDLIDTIDGTNLLIDRFWGLSQRYQLGGGDAQPLVGCSAPDFELQDGDRLGPKMESGRGVLIDFGNDENLKGLVKGSELKIDYLGLSAHNSCGLRALLVRPDGVVAWATEDKDEPDMNSAKAALQQWFAY